MNLGILVKGRAFGEGTIRTHGGVKVKKVGKRWVPVKGEAVKKTGLTVPKTIHTPRLDLQIQNVEGKRLFVEAYPNEAEVGKNWLTQAMGRKKVVDFTVDIISSSEARLNRADSYQRGQGYALETIRAVTDLLSTKGIHRFVGYIEASNVASVSMMQKLGAERAGETDQGSYWELLKGKKRPIGYVTPGGFVKTPKGWRKKPVGKPSVPKLSAPEPPSPVAGPEEPSLVIGHTYSIQVERLRVKTSRRFMGKTIEIQKQIGPMTYEIKMARSKKPAVLALQEEGKLEGANIRIGTKNYSILDRVTGPPEKETFEKPPTLAKFVKMTDSELYAYAAKNFKIDIVDSIENNRSAYDNLMCQTELLHHLGFTNKSLLKLSIVDKLYTADPNTIVYAHYIPFKSLIEVGKKYKRSYVHEYFHHLYSTKLTFENRHKEGVSFIDKVSKTASYKRMEHIDDLRMKAGYKLYYSAATEIAARFGNQLVYETLKERGIEPPVKIASLPKKFHADFSDRDFMDIRGELEPMFKAFQFLRLAILFKGKERPIGHKTPGGYVKTAEGWRKKTSDKQELPAHIAAIRIPPAWTDVQYAKDPDADLLVRGKDAKGRAQYVYSARFHTKKTVEKFARVNALNEVYASIKTENRTNASAGKKEALVLLLVMETGIRPGGVRDTKAAKKAYGATTLEGRHVVQEGDTVLLKFTGKKGIDLSIPIKSKRLASVLLKKKKQAGDDDKLFSVDAARLSNYTHSLGGGRGFKTKDLRTHLGTATAIAAIKQMEKPVNKTAYKKSVREVAKVVAATLGNTATIALQAYINPVVFAKWKVVA